METVTPSESPQWVLGTDDREYRRLADYDEHYADAYLVDAATGARKLIAKKQRGTMTWSPSGRYLLNFDGKDWSTISVPDGKKVEPHCHPRREVLQRGHRHARARPALTERRAGPRTARAVLLYDRYDIWRVSPDGTGAKNITAGYGRAHDLRLRYIRTEADNPRERWIDAAKPLHAPGRKSEDVRNRTSSAPRSMAASPSSSSWRRNLMRRR